MSPLDLHRITDLHTQDGGHEFRNGQAFPFEPRACSLCGGDCPTPAACFLPEAAPAPRTRRFPAISRPIVVGALLALPGVAMFAYEGIRYVLQP